MSSYALGNARSNGWWGMVIFLMSEAALFLMLFATYFYLRLQSSHWPPAHLARPPILVPTLLTAALLATSFPMQRAWRAAGRGARGAVWRWLALAAAVQGGYLVWEIHDYVDSLHTLRPQGSAYASIYATLVGADHLHVFVGMLLTLWLLARFTTRITPYRLRALQAITFYWHVVNVITVLVLAVSLSPHL